MLLLVFIACSTGEPPQPPPAQRVESTDLGIAIAALPSSFTVIESGPAGMVLQGAGATGPARLEIQVDPEETGGINLVAMAEGSREWFEQQAAGQYFGNLELMTPFGSAFTARGSYEGAAGPVEELRVFSLHPGRNSVMRLTFRYPPGEGKQRMEELAGLLGEIEPLAADAQEGELPATDS